MYIRKKKETSGFLNASLTLSNQMECKFCRVIHNDSSTIIQTSSGQTVYQCLSKIFIKKQIPWYKCDIYFHDEFQVVNFERYFIKQLKTKYNFFC